jgi:hypothetical protein
VYATSSTRRRTIETKEAKKAKKRKILTFLPPAGEGNYRFDGTREQLSASGVVPKKLDGDQENETVATRTTRNRNTTRVTR